MQAIKYMHPHFAADAEKGQLWIGTFDSYAKLESERRDDREALLEKKIDRLHIPDGRIDTQNRKVASALGIKIEGGTNITIENGTTTARYIPCYCFCMSKLDTVSSIDCTQTAKFRISGVRTLAKMIVKKYPEKFAGYWEAQAVNYQSLVVNAMTHWNVAPSPFRKDLKFSAEREVRIIWHPAPNQPLVPFLTDEDPAIANLIRKIKDSATQSK